MSPLAVREFPQDDPAPPGQLTSTLLPSWSVKVPLGLKMLARI